MNFRQTTALITTFCTMLSCFGSSLTAEEVGSNKPVEDMTVADPATAEVILATLTGGAPATYQRFTRDSDEEYYLSRVQKGAYHFLYAWAGQGEAIQLHDASKWSVNPIHQSIVTKWQNDEPLFLKPASSVVNSGLNVVITPQVIQNPDYAFPYFLYNYQRNEVIEVRMTEPPTYQGVETRWITQVAKFSGNTYVYLNDNTVWQIDSTNNSSKKWQPEDRVIVGLNDLWRTSKYPHILINVTMNKAPYCGARVAN